MHRAIIGHFCEIQTWRKFLSGELLHPLMGTAVRVVANNLGWCFQPHQEEALSARLLHSQAIDP